MAEFARAMVSKPPTPPIDQNMGNHHSDPMMNCQVGMPSLQLPLGTCTDSQGVAIACTQPAATYTGGTFQLNGIPQSLCNSMGGGPVTLPDPCGLSSTKGCSDAIGQTDGRFVLYNNDNDPAPHGWWPKVGNYREYVCNAGECRVAMTGPAQQGVAAPYCPVNADARGKGPHLEMCDPCFVVPSGTGDTPGLCATALGITSTQVPTGTNANFVVYNHGGTGSAVWMPPKGQYREFNCTNAGDPGPSCGQIANGEGPDTTPPPAPCPQMAADGVVTACKAA